MRYPSDVHALNFINVIDPLFDECFDVTNQEPLTLILNRNLDKNETIKLSKEFGLGEELLNIAIYMETKIMKG